MRLVAGIPPSYPTGTCYVCGNDPGNAPVIATDIQIDFEGELAICGVCWADGAALLGFATPETVERLKAQIETLKAKAADAKAKSIDSVDWDKVVAAAHG